MAEKQRPLSPHLQIYRWTITMATSILHRFTGMALSAGAVLLTAWLVALASGPDWFACVNGFMSHWLGLLIMAGFTFSLFFHLVNGIRHLFWDMGFGFELPTARLTGWIGVGVAALFTLAVWLIGLGMLEVG